MTLYLLLKYFVILHNWQDSNLQSPPFRQLPYPLATVVPPFGFNVESQIQLNLMRNEVDSSLKFTVRTVGTKHLLTSQVYELWILLDLNQ